jgi:positive regulator of sigma E activity
MRGVFRVDVVVVVSERAGGASLLCVGESSISSCACMYSCAAVVVSSTASAALVLRVQTQRLRSCVTGSADSSITP